MNIRIDDDWAAFKAVAISRLGHQGAAAFLRFASKSVSMLGPEGMKEHLDFAAEAVEAEGRYRARAALETEVSEFAR